MSTKLLDYFVLHWLTNYWLISYEIRLTCSLLTLSCSKRMRAIQGTHLLSQVLHGHLSFTGCTCHFILRRLSPMVAIQSLMTCLAVVACNSDCVVGKLDIKRAFIQTEMTGGPVYAQCRGKLKDLIVMVLPELREYLGSLYTDLCVFVSYVLVSIIATYVFMFLCYTDVP